MRLDQWCLSAALLLGWAGLSLQESADLTPFHGFLPQRKLRALTPPGDSHPNDIYQRSRPRPDPIPAGFEIKYPDYKFTFDIPKDPERPVYIIAEKTAAPAITGHHACDGHGHGATVAPPIRPTVAPPRRPTVAPPRRPTVALPARPVKALPSRPTIRPAMTLSGSRRPVQLTSSATLSRPKLGLRTKPQPVRSRVPRPRPQPPRPTLLTKSRDPVLRPRPSPRPTATGAPPTPSVFARMKGKLRKYPADQYRVFPGGYARLSTYSSLSG